MSYKGYHFFIGDLEVPYAPSELTVTINSKNQTVDLINGKEINILKEPGLTEYSFEIELPRGRQYPFANKLVPSKTYTDYFEKIMLSKKPIKLVITRPNPLSEGFTTFTGANVKVQPFDSIEKTVSLEGYKLKESADNAYDMRVSLTFKEYINYGTSKKIYVPPTKTNNTEKKEAVKTTPKPPTTESKKYTIKSGDCLWNIARAEYGDGTKYTVIYEANKQVIEDTAKKYGRASSSNGHWIYPGTELIIPSTKK